MLQRIRKFAAAAVLAATPLFTLMMPGIAHAAAITWTGGGADGNWSTVGNWLGGVAPVSTDSVVIDNAANFTNGSTDDIAGLSLAGISFVNNKASNIAIIKVAQPLTVTGAISQDATVTTTTDYIEDNGSAVTITLGGNLTITPNAGIGIGGTGTALSLALGGNTLTYATGLTDGVIINTSATITGAGAVVYNAANLNFQVDGNNTYSGTTHVIANGLPIDNTGTDNNAFGTSAITVENGGSISFDYSVNTTITNAITITGSTNGSPVTSLDFSSANSGTTITVPNLTFNGDTRFGNDQPSNLPITVNLAGNTANGHCVEYLGYGNDATNGPANGFVNGPPGCVLAASIGGSGLGGAGGSAPKTPDTGFALAAAHPAITLGATLTSALAILAIARTTRKHATARR